MTSWLRERRGKLERAWASDKHDARAKAQALSVLGSAVVLVAHPYDRHPNSGAGNCWCGRAPNESLHKVILDPPVLSYGRWNDS